MRSPLFARELLVPRSVRYLGGLSRTAAHGVALHCGAEARYATPSYAATVDLMSNIVTEQRMSMLAELPVLVGDVLNTPSFKNGLDLCASSLPKQGNDRHHRACRSSSGKRDAVHRVVPINAVGRMHFDAQQFGSPLDDITILHHKRKDGTAFRRHAEPRFALKQSGQPRDVYCSHRQIVTVKHPVRHLEGV